MALPDDQVQKAEAARLEKANVAGLADQLKRAEAGRMFGIGRAVKEMQNGARVSRAGWNGKGMYLAYQPGYPDGVPINANTARATGLPEGTVCKFLPYIVMKTADGSFVPWLCSQTDLLAVDWGVVA